MLFAVHLQIPLEVYGAILFVVCYNDNKACTQPPMAGTFFYYHTPPTELLLFMELGLDAFAGGKGKKGMTFSQVSFHISLIVIFLLRACFFGYSR